MFAFGALCAGDVSFNCTRWADLYAGICIKGELGSGDRHAELLSGKIAEAKVTGITDGYVTN